MCVYTLMTLTMTNHVIRKGKIATATFNTQTYTYEFDNVQHPIIQFSATMEPIEKSNSLPQSLLELPYRRKDLKITLEEYTDDQASSPQLASLIEKKRKLCSFEYDLSDCFLQMKQHHQRLGEKCSVTLPLMTLVPKSFSKVFQSPEKKLEKKGSILSNVMSRKPALFSTKSSGSINTATTTGSDTHNLGGLLLLKMSIQPHFTSDDDEETVESDTAVSTDNLMTDDYASDLDEEFGVRERSDSLDRVSLDLPRTKVSDPTPRRISLDLARNTTSTTTATTAATTISNISTVSSETSSAKKKLVYIASPRPHSTTIDQPQSLQITTDSDSTATTTAATTITTTSPPSVTVTVQRQQDLVSNTPSPTIVIDHEDETAFEKQQEKETTNIVTSTNSTTLPPPISIPSPSPVVLNTHVDLSLIAEKENIEMRSRIATLEQELIKYKEQVELIDKTVVEDKTSEYEQKIVTLQQTQLSLTQKQHELQQLNEQITEKYNGVLDKLNESQLQLEIVKKNEFDRLKQLENDNELLNMQLRVLDDQKKQLEATIKTLQSELSKMRIRLKYQESKLLEQQQQQQQQIEETNTTAISSTSSENFHPIVLAVMWGLMVSFCMVLAFPFTYQTLSQEDKSTAAEYLFGQCLGGFGAYALFTFFALHVAQKLQLHMYGTYTVHFLRTQVVSLSDYKLFTLDADFIENAKSSSLWGLCLGFIVKFIDWLLLHRWIVNSDSGNNPISSISIWKKIFYSVYCGVADELIGRLFLFLLFVDVCRRLRIHLLAKHPDSFWLAILSLKSLEGKKLKEDDNTDSNQSTDNDHHHHSNSLLVGNGLTKLILCAMVLSSICFSLCKCPWEMTMYPPSGIFSWLISLVRCIFIHGSTSMVFCYMFFIQENIEFAMLAHIVYEVVMQW
jgi:hypothetical protein